VTFLSLKLIYVTLYPEKYPRIEKIRNAIKDRKDVVFQVLVPKVRIKLGNKKYERVVSALINYTCYIAQILFTKADFYWVTTSPDIFVLPIILKGNNYILEYRNPSGLETEMEFGKIGILAEYMEKIALKHSEAISLTTSTLAKRVEAFQKKVFVIPNYPQKKTFKNTVSAEEFRAIHGVKRNEKIVLFVGRLSKSEGFDILPGMIKELSKLKEKVIFWIIGDGPLRSIATGLEKEYPENVKFFGWQPYKEIPNFINSADVCIAPRPQTPTSDYCNEEGIHKISEYMFYRKPIVACGISQSKEYLLVRQEDMAKGILEALKGKAPRPSPRSWEDDCVGKVLEVIRFAEATKKIIKPH
jgi:glycosyltransferase involved in cell wall biosynthesis